MKIITGIVIKKDEIKRTNTCFENKDPKFNLMFSKSHQYF